MDVKSRFRTTAADAIPLCNGTGAFVRPISPDDCAAVAEFHRRLSDRTRFLWRFSPHSILSGEEVQGLTCVDGLNHVALVVEVEGTLIAIGRYDRLCVPWQAEVNLVVADDAYQRQYIAAELLCRLAHVARMAGVAQFRAEVLPENTTMLEVCREAGYPCATIDHQASVTMTMDIS